MKKQALLGFDNETQRIKAALINLQQDILTSFSTPIDLDTPNPAWAEQGPQTWWQSTSHNIQSIFSEERFDPV